MFELIKKILETGKERNVGLSVAYEMLKNEGHASAEFEEAKKVLDRHYETITALIRNGYEDKAKEFVEAEDKLAFIEELKKNGIPCEN